MGWFQDHAVLFALLCAAAAVVYGLALTRWLLTRPAGNQRMQEIARAVQEGAAAYLRRQYSTIAVVAIVPFLLLGFYHKLGWGTAVGFLIGASLSAAPGDRRPRRARLRRLPDLRLRASRRRHLHESGRRRRRPRREDRGRHPRGRPAQPGGDRRQRRRQRGRLRRDGRRPLRDLRGHRGGGHAAGRTD